MNPEPPAGGDPIGDGQFALATDRPQTIEELVEAVARRVAEGHALYPQGGQTALDYGGIPTRPGAAIDVRGLDRIVDYPAADMTVTVEAGITLGSLREALAREGQRLWVEAPQPDRATLGGIFATDSSGPRRFGLGRPRDQILGVRYVSAAGEVVKGGGRVVKNVAGYDLPKLLTGSLGTLGIIAEMTLKVRPAPESSALAWASYPSLAAASDALDALNTSATRPVAVELLNPPAARAIFPGQQDGAWAVVVGFEDNRASIEWQADRIAAELASGKPTVVRDAEVEPFWAALVESQAAGDGPIRFRASLRPSALARFLDSVDPGLWSVQAHAGNGIARGAWIGEARDLDAFADEIGLLRERAKTLGGTLILPRCPTAWKGRLRVWGDPRPDWGLSAKVKRALDPAGVLNPGRFLDTIG
ncbi:FAD-binding oxidoreductase [Tundrisphaera sp. TA3]|uniref:FAD-binding oxidoreductase n=1 Tax=Tundrisphaera sp. TA3 TaxID=3435775 RepID=UPI003EBD58DB